MNKHQKEHMKPEFGVDSRYKSKKEKEQDSIELMESRLERMKNLSAEDLIRARLMQLKLQMEDYIKNPVYDDKHHFATFLKSYIDTVYEKRIDFAKDINVTPIYLSKVLNSHRDPNETFLLKLMVHAEKTYKKVADFSKTTWYEVYLHEKLYNTMSDQDKWRHKIEKQVKTRKALIK